MVIDTFSLTLLFIFISTIVAVFIQRVSRDKCLKDFSDNFVNLELVDGNIIKGKLYLLGTGLEIEYGKDIINGNVAESSFILYKSEFAKILSITRFHSELSDKNREVRQRELKKTYKPGFFRRLKRKIVNTFKTIKDSILEIINTFINLAKKSPRTGEILTSQDKYVNQIKHDIAGSFDASFEPLLERHIGRRVVVEMMRGQEIISFSGILKEYTAEFIELMSAQYRPSGMEGQGDGDDADVIVPRKYAAVRHLAGMSQL